MKKKLAAIFALSMVLSSCRGGCGFGCGEQTADLTPNAPVLFDDSVSLAVQDQVESGF